MKHPTPENFDKNCDLSSSRGENQLERLERLRSKP